MLSGRFLLVLTVAAVVVAAGAYAYARQVGVEVRTSADALVPPAMAPPSLKSADGRVTTVVQVTPAPWPEEAGTIHWLSSLGIPVRVVVEQDDGPVRFVVRKAAGGRLVAVFQTQADAERLDLVIPGGP